MSITDTHISTAEDSDASTVSMGDERSNASSYFEAGNVDINEDSFMLSEIENSIEHSVEEQEKPKGKVNVSDIFNKLKPSKVRNNLDQELDYPLPIVTPIESVPVPKTQYGITAKDLLTGNPSKKAQREKKQVEKEEPITLDVDTPLEELIPKPKSGITAKDLLTGKYPQRSSTPIPEDAEMIELVTSDEEQGSNVDTKKKRKYKKREKESKKTLNITLKYKPHKQRIADLESKIRNSMASSVSARDLFKKFDKKKEEPPQHLITLKISPEKLKTIETVEPDTLFTQGTPHVNGAKSYLDLLSYKPIVVKNPIYKLKEIQPPIISRDEMHVIYDYEPIQHRNITLPKKHDLQLDELNYSLIDKIPKKATTASNYDFEIEYFDNFNIEELIKSKLPNIDDDSRFKKFLQYIDQQNPNNLLWTNLFKPETPSQILFDKDMTYKMQTWLKNSFKILKKHTKRPNLRKLKKIDDEMNDFIIDEDDEETDDEAFVPIMILKGPEGVGKSSSIYSLVENLSGYVYEINASQSRGRKDIMTTLKELVTTQLVHQDSKNTDDFQKGVILFEDVDVLFESDKGFWTVMEHVLTISRRPIILTCKDLSMIPENIMECASKEQSIFEIPKQPLEELRDYLWLIGVTKGLDIDDQLILDLIEENSRDLRKCISALQILCEIPNNNQLIKLTKKPTNLPSTIQDESDLNKLTQIIDCYSVSDMIQTKTKSFISHELLENEVLTNEVYFNEEELKTDPLPFEYNLSQDFQSLLPLYPSDCFQNSPKYIKKLDELFWNSKLKQMKRLTRQSAYSMFDFNEDSSQVENVFNLPPSVYTTDVSPVFRAFSRNEIRIDHYNNQIIAQNPDSKIEDLLRDRLLISKNFKAKSDILLYGPLRYWNV